MSSGIAIMAALQLAVPFALLALQAKGHDTNLVVWSLKHGGAWSYLYATAIAGVWLLLPWYVPHVLIIVSASLAARTLPGAFALWRTPATRRQWMVLAVDSAVAAVGAATLSTALQGRTPPGGTIVDLQFPLKAGHYYVANGGSKELVNAHVRMLTGDRFVRYRGSSYGIDIVALSTWGNRADGFTPRDPEQYAIFGRAIYAPCEGVVVRVEDYLDDLPPPEVDRGHMAGNFVMLECGDDGEFHVLLGHMRRGSVKVHPGDYVTTDTQLGQVGNSGNSDEPHLHVHAQRPGEMWDLFAGNPLPMRFNGRYLVRNNRLTLATDSGDVIDD